MTTPSRGEETAAAATSRPAPPTIASTLTLIESNARAIRHLQEDNLADSVEVLMETLALARDDNNGGSNSISGENENGDTREESGAAPQQLPRRHLEVENFTPEGEQTEVSDVEPEEIVIGRSSENNDGQGEVQNPVPGSILSSLPLVDSEAYSTTEPTGASPDNMFCFYNRAIDISVDDTTLAFVSSDTLRQDLRRRCLYQAGLATVLYNIGVIFHQRGLNHGLSGALDRGLEMYDMAKQVVSAVVSHVNGQPGRDATRRQDVCLDLDGIDIDLLTMALWNNSGHVHSYFLRNDEASRQVDILQSMLVSMTGLRDRYAGSVSPQDVALFEESICAFSSIAAGRGQQEQRPASAA